MSLKRRLAALAAVIAALAIGAPVASASAAPIPVASPVVGSIGCPVWYGSGSAATGCAPYWVIEQDLLTHPYHAWLGR